MLLTRGGGGGTLLNKPYRYVPPYRGVMNGPLKFLTARKICSCSLQNSNHRKCVGGGGGGGEGRSGKEVGSGDVLFWSLPGCVHATLLSTISCNF